MIDVNLIMIYIHSDFDLFTNYLLTILYLNYHSLLL